MVFLHVAVERLDVEAELPKVLWLELLDFQLESHQALQGAVEEDEVDREVLVADLHRVLGAHEAEITTELCEKSSELAEQGSVKVRLGVAVGQREELEVVGVLEDLDGARVSLCQHCRHFLRARSTAESGSRLDLPLEFAR